MTDDDIYQKIVNERKLAGAHVEKNNLTPVPKVAAAGIAGAVTVLVVFAVNLIWPELVIPNEVAMSFTAIVSFAAGYIKS